MPALTPETDAARILLVDDDTSGAQTVAEALRGLGHEVLLAHNWTEALRLFGDEVDLVFMDAVMPEVDGFKLTRVLRERAHCYTPILFLTGLGDAAAKERGVVAGADDFLTKPPDPAELRVRLAAMLRIRRLTQELEAERQSYQRMAHIDELTGLPNRRAYDERLTTELKLSLRGERPLSLVLVDIDHFKAINDELGHSVGDEVLTFMGKLLRETTRRNDWPFRYGGEEFAVLARDTRCDQAMILAERIRKAFAERSPQTRAGARTCSIGVGCLGPQCDSGEGLFALADARLYAAKQAGRDRVVGADDPEP